MIVTGCLGAKDGGDFVRDSASEGARGDRTARDRRSDGGRASRTCRSRTIRSPTSCRRRASSSRRSTTRISRSAKAAITAARSASFPSMRGDLVQPPDRRSAGRSGAAAATPACKELLVISQDTSAYGVDVRYRTGFWQGRPLKTRMTELAAALDAMARAHGAWVRLHYVYPYPHVDEVIARMTDDPARRRPPPLPRRAVPAREPAHPEADEAAGERRRHAAAHRSVARRAAGPRHPQHVHRRLPRRDGARVRGAARVSRGRAARSRRLLRLFAGRRRRGQRAARSGARRGEGRAPRALHGGAGDDQRRAARAARRPDDDRAGRRRTTATTAIARSAADAPEIDGTVRIANGAGCRSGTFARVTVTGAAEHDLDAVVAAVSADPRCAAADAREALRRSSSSRRARAPSSTSRSGAARACRANRSSCGERHQRGRARSRSFLALDLRALDRRSGAYLLHRAP